MARLDLGKMMSVTLQHSQSVTDLAAPIRRPWRWHIVVFLAPALLVYSALMETNG